MPTNFYIQNFPSSQITSEHLLVEDLVIESMKFHGMDVYYLPRYEVDSVDMLYGEDPIKEYNTAHAIEMYLENVTGMEGEQDFISKFGLEIRDEAHLLVSRRRFKMSVALDRPREGDLIYIPLFQNFFEITFVEHENDQAMFHTLGRGRGGNVYLYALRLKQFVFSEEIIDTGVDEIDRQIFDEYKRTRLVLLNTAPYANTFIPTEIIYQGSDLANANARAIVHTFVSNSYIDVIRVKGTFANGVITGVTSGASRTLSYNTTNYNEIFEDLADNEILEKEGDVIIDFTEINPFSEDI